MRALAAVAVLSIVTSSPPASAETWRTKVTLMEAGSPSNCVEADVSKLFYDLTVTDRQLSVKADSGETYSTPVAADGSVKTTFTGSLGANVYSLELTGNVKTREFEAFNKRFSCRFKLTPVQ
jgi:hypothetical protein